MKSVKKLEYARWIVAGGIFGAAVAGIVSSGLGLDMNDFGHDKIGALVGGVITAIMVKVGHLA